MKNLLASVVAFAASLSGLALVIWIGLHDVAATATSRAVARVVDFILPLFGLRQSVVIEPATSSVSLPVVTLAFVILSTGCFWWVVRELRLKYGRRPNHALQRTRPSHHCCNRTPSCAGSLSLGR
jgi:hypothetical protein